MGFRPPPRTTARSLVMKPAARRFAPARALGCALLLAATTSKGQEADATAPVNLAVVATPSSSAVSGDTSEAALNDGSTPRSSRDARRGSYGNWPNRGTQWVQYDWSRPIRTNRIEVYWWDDRRGVRLPKACRLKSWDGKDFTPVAGATGLGVAGDTFNVTTFDEMTTTKLRLEFDGDGEYSTGILEWRVLDSGNSPDFPPSVSAGVDRVVVLGGKTYLNGRVKTLRTGTPLAVTWSRVSGPGKVEFADARAAETTATFDTPGDHVLQIVAGE